MQEPKKLTREETAELTGKDVYAEDYLCMPIHAGLPKNLAAYYRKIADTLENLDDRFAILAVTESGDIDTILQRDKRMIVLKPCLGDYKLLKRGTIEKVLLGLSDGLTANGWIKLPAAGVRGTMVFDKDDAENAMGRAAEGEFDGPG